MYPGFIAQSKKVTSRFILPIVKIISKTGITPNILTALSFISGLISIYFLFSSRLLFAIFIILSVIFDILDGNLARYTKKKTKFGSYLDDTSDRFVNLLMILKYNFVFGLYWLAPVLFILHYWIIKFFFKVKNVIYVRTFLAIFFIFAFYNIGMLIISLLLALGILIQIIELIRK